MRFHRTAANKNRNICIARRVLGRQALSCLHSLSRRLRWFRRIRHRATDMLGALFAGNRGRRMGSDVADCRNRTSDIGQQGQSSRPLMRHARTGFIDHLISEIALHWIRRGQFRQRPRGDGERSSTDFRLPAIYRPPSTAPHSFGCYCNLFCETSDRLSMEC